MKKYFNVIYLAPASLVVAMIGFFLTLKSANEAARIAHAFFEASMVGGLADWFAVVALFRHPMGLPIPHTSIIRKNRAKITGKIVDMLETQWLTREAIQKKIGGYDFAATVAETAADPANSAGIDSFARELAGRAAEAVRNSGDAVRKAVSDVVASMNEKIGRMDFIGQLASALEGNSDNFRSIVLNEADGWLLAPETNFVFAEKVKKIVLSYSDRYEIVKTAVDFGEMIGVLDYESIAAEIVRALREEIDAARLMPGHPICIQLDESYKNMIDRIRANEKLTALPAALMGAAVGGLDVPGMAAEYAESKREEIAAFLASTARAVADELGRDGGRKDAFNEWARGEVTEMVERHHPEIGRIVKENIDAINDEDLVDQIEDRVGEDLQYIRINGAIVGGLVGTLIYLVRNYLLAAR